jgi:hypothetical protein
MIDTAHTAAPASRARHPVLPPGAVLVRGLAASAVAIGAAFTITYLVRVLFNANAFEDAGGSGSGFPNSGALSVGVLVATLLAVLVLQLLQRVTDRPFAAFAVVLALGYLAFFGVSATSSLTASQIAGQLLVALPLAAVIAGLASWATGVRPEAP